MTAVDPSRQFFHDSVDDFMRKAYDDKCRVPANETWRWENNSGREMPEWWGMTRKRDGTATTHKDVQRVVQEGWLEGSAMVFERMEALEVPWVPSIRRRLTWTDQGDHLEMPRVYSGQLDTAWQMGKRRHSSGPRSVRIVVDNCYHAGMEPEDVQWRGIAAIAVANALINAGHNVELASAFKVIQTGKNYAGMIITKPLMMPLDLANIAATTAFSGFFRNTCLAYLWSVFEDEDFGGCGTVAKLEPEDVSAFGYSLTFIVPAGTDSQDKAQEWVNKTITAFSEGPEV